MKLDEKIRAYIFLLKIADRMLKIVIDEQPELAIRATKEVIEEMKTNAEVQEEDNKLDRL